MARLVSPLMATSDKRRYDAVIIGGGHNGLVAAAYLAAATGEPVAMRHLVQGIGRELQKSGRAPSRSAFGPYYRFLIEPGPPAGRGERAASS